VNGTVNSSYSAVREKGMNPKPSFACNLGLFNALHEVRNPYPVKCFLDINEYNWARRVPGLVTSKDLSLTTCALNGG
jgi:hypothetical protein